jgi:hypothetical protein
MKLVKVHAVIRENRRLTVHDVSEEVGISKSSCHTILTENWKCTVLLQNLCHVFDKKQTVSRSVRNRLIVQLLTKTGDETWVYGYDIETKAHSSQWLGKSSSRPKKSHQSRSNMQVVLRAFLKEGRRSSCVCSTWSDSQWTVLLGGHEVSEGGRAEEKA